MGQKSQIQWTDDTWNVARGCTKVSEGCKYCYMMRDGEKFGYDGSIVQRTKTVFNLPLKLPTGRMVFTSSLTDFFHPDIDSFRHEAWQIIRQRPDLYFQILTKRPERILQSLPADWFTDGGGILSNMFRRPAVWDHVWMGASIESNKHLNRLTDLYRCGANVNFISFEPLLDDIIDFKKFVQFYQRPDGSNPLKWVIVGGESGNDKGNWLYRPCEVSWMERIVDVCQEFDIPVFVKQMGTYLAKAGAMSDRHGGNIDEFPESLQIRQLPIAYKIQLPI